MEKINKQLVNFYKGKTVLVTGHTGFKGTWLVKILKSFGANVIGYALNPSTNPSLYNLIGIDKDITSIIGDIRDFDLLKKVFYNYQPELVFHLAAQPIVKDSYINPHYTYETNVMGTVNVLECIRLSKSVKSFLNVTTDKVYENNENGKAFTEKCPLDGYDPYSNSKSCSELVTHSYKKSFLDNLDIAVSTARAGNVIGGGDFSNYRIIADCVRALENKETMVIRNPHSVRPYQHVLEPLFAYLIIAMKQYNNHNLCGYYNVGPNRSSCITTGELVNMFGGYFQNFEFKIQNDNGPHEAGYLFLNNNLLKKTFGIKPVLSVKKAVRFTAMFTKIYLKKGDLNKEMNKEITFYIAKIEAKK